MSLKPSTHVKGEEGSVAFKALFFGSQVVVIQYGEGGKKSTAVQLHLANLDEPAKHRKFPEKWTLGNPVRIIPNDEAVTIKGTTYPPNTTYLDAKNPANEDPSIFLSSGYSVKAEQMIKAGCPEAELPDRDVRGLDGLIFDVELRNEPVYPGAKQTTDRIVPVKYYGRATAQQIQDAVTAAQAAQAVEPQGNTPVSGDAALVAQQAAVSVSAPAPAGDLDIEALKAQFISEIARRAAEKPVPVKDLTGIVVTLFKDNDAAKRALVPIVVNPIEAKKAFEAAGLKHSGTEVSL